MKIRISNKWIGNNQPVFVVAEAGINHNGNIKTAKKLILEAKKAGANAIKFQTFRAEDLTSHKSKFFNSFTKLELSDSNFKELAEYARKKGIIFFSTPFSEKAVELLSGMHVPAIKIASGDLTNISLIKYAASKMKVMIISTGMANMDETKTAVKAIESAGNKKIIIMHSVSSYPTPPVEVNLKAMLQLKKEFPYPIGFSDNGSDLFVPLTSVAVGAKIIEKHFTLNKKMIGLDHSFSANPTQLKELVKKTREIEKLLGDGKKRCQPSEFKNRINARRSITAIKTIQKGSKIRKDMVSMKRPATGIEPIYLGKVMGKVTRRKIKIHESLKWQQLRS